MRTLSLFLSFSLLSLHTLVLAEEEAATPAAESTTVPEVPTRCRAQVSYVLKRAENQEESGVFGAVEERGASAVKAKEALTSRLNSAKQSAKELCRSRHENLSGCIGAKYEANGALLERLEFGARKSLQEAITSDCQKAQGVCLESRSSEPECEALPTGTDGTGSAEGGGEKKGDKKEKEAPGKKAASSKKK